MVLNEWAFVPMLFLSCMQVLACMCDKQSPHKLTTKAYAPAYFWNLHRKPNQTSPFPPHELQLLLQRLTHVHYTPLKSLQRAHELLFTLCPSFFPWLCTFWGSDWPWAVLGVRIAFRSTGSGLYVIDDASTLWVFWPQVCRIIRTVPEEIIA